MSGRTRDVVVVGASAGGVEALRAFVGALPEDLAAAMVVVLHLPAGGTSALPAILERAGTLPARTAQPGEEIRSGVVYVAPPDHHLLIENDRFVLSHGPAENGHRPAINVLFRSAALALGSRVVGVILSGNLDDGVNGLAAIVARDGQALVQDPHEALYPGMPEAALHSVRTHAALPAAELAKHLKDVVVTEMSEADAEPPELSLQYEVALARDADRRAGKDIHQMGAETEYTCPDCGGSLVDIYGIGASFRCHVGHGWSLAALHDAKRSGVEQALWTALRTLEEKADLSERLEASASDRGHTRLRYRHQQDHREAADAAAVLREMLLGDKPSDDHDQDEPVEAGHS